MRLENAHINRGGEIEKRKSFATRYTLPAGTFGLAAASGALYVFGPTTNPGVPAGVTYQQLTPPALFTMLRVLSVQSFAGALFVIVEYTNGQVRHFYNGTIVTNYTLDANIQTARIALAFKEKMYLAYGSMLASSKIADPTDYNIASTGAAIYDMSTQAAGAETLTGLAEYQDNLAIFSRRAVQIWSFAADPAASAKLQTLSRIGTLSPRSVLSVGGTDVFFVADSGVRSLRVRDVAGNASVQDAGTPIDDTLTGLLRGLTATQREAIFAELEPTTGRYLVTIGDTTFVFSYFPGVGISAWSTYFMPTGASEKVAVDDRIFVRAGNTVHQYGGEDGDTYDSSEAVAETPYVDGRTIATWKNWRGIDVACTGTWQVYASFDPQQPTVEDLVAELTGSTFYQLDDALAGAGPMVKLRFVSVGDTAAILSSVVLHYESYASR